MTAGAHNIIITYYKCYTTRLIDLCDRLNFWVGHMWPLAAQSLITENTDPAGGALGHIFNASN